ncbi:MAG: 2-phospho-L-lactate transferase [Candidatus Kariarchaeaceae archaeon]|jgi:LPPG:FO 2-phospho-L-lactate transferase
MKLCFLSGGTGTPKLLQGFREILDDKFLGVICNTGDDYYWQNLHISPDLDTLLYLFSDRLDLSKFWGVKDESFHALDSLKSLGIDTWFNVGDKDLGLHIYRTNLLKSLSLTDITKMITKRWNVRSTILPMCDQQLQTLIYSQGSALHFQEYFVKYGTDISVDHIEFAGIKDRTTEDVQTLLQKSKNIIIGPSNPITSMGPILSIEPIHQSLQKFRKKTIAVSPIVGNQAFSGPTAKLMRQFGLDVSPPGIAKYYSKQISQLIIDSSDKKYKNVIQDYDIEPVLVDINLTTMKQKQKLAEELLSII